MRLRSFIQIPDTFDPDDRRRRQILNMLLSFCLIISLVCLFVTFTFGDSLSGVLQDSDALLILRGSFVAILGFASLFVINRWKRAGSLAGWLFSLTLISLICISDTPQELVKRGLITWTLPILASGVVLPPLAVFPITGIVCLINFYITAILLGGTLNPYAIVIFFLLAVLTWLGMSIANEAIRAARNEAQKNAAILNGVADGVLVLNENDDVVLANPVALSLIGNNPLELVSQEKRQQEICGRVLAFEWSDVRGVGRVAIVRDISRQVEIDRAKDAMLGTVSHEMRTPLAAILGFAEVIAARSETMREMADRIHANARRLIHMVDDLLDHAQAQAGALKIRSEPVALGWLMESVTTLLSGLAAEKKLVVKTHIDPDLPRSILGDGGRLHQILVNLVGNAVKFTDQGEIGIFFQKKESDWVMIVQDTGIGIPAERLPDIFEPFRRGSDYATRKSQGAGLGLSIVKTLVTLMSGRVRVESAADIGSVFTVTLPLQKANS